MQRKLVALVFIGTIFFALPVLAQSNSIGTSALTISAAPAYPSPNTTVTLTAESPLLDLQNSTITWVVNGATVGTGISTKVQLGAVGKETDVSVSVSGPSGSDSASLALVPTSIDLLWEGDSYVPPFYKGRAVPGSNSSIRVLAIPHFITTSGKGVASSNIQFTWSVNGAVDRAQSGVGESSAIFPAAVLYGNDTIDVVARSTDGSLSGEASIVVPTQNPQLVLYEDNPLFGIMYHRPLSQSSTANESETSFAAVPYFSNAKSANDTSLAYNWTVNGSAVAADPKDPSEITITTKSAGIANIALSIVNAFDPFFSASGSWQVSFTGASGTGSDQFHSSSQ
ncbi:MAG: hypothetical protein P4L81_00790 [Candidatus Pacebacteria bacterium]|nr:hypothetical protein [Candidatus Paceibacterota bacterium]